MKKFIYAKKNVFVNLKNISYLTDVTFNLDVYKRVRVTHLKKDLIIFTTIVSLIYLELMKFFKHLSVNSFFLSFFFQINVFGWFWHIIRVNEENGPPRLKIQSVVRQILCQVSNFAMWVSASIILNYHGVTATCWTWSGIQMTTYSFCQTGQCATFHSFSFLNVLQLPKNWKSVFMYSYLWKIVYNIILTSFYSGLFLMGLKGFCHSFPFHIIFSFMLPLWYIEV